MAHISSAAPKDETYQNRPQCRAHDSAVWFLLLQSGKLLQALAAKDRNAIRMTAGLFGANLIVSGASAAMIFMHQAFGMDINRPAVRRRIEAMTNASDVRLAT